MRLRKIEEIIAEARKNRRIMNDQVTSYIRTVVPLVVGAIVAWLAQKGINIPADLIASTTALITALVGTLYYIIVRKLEQKWPKLGVLLGIAKAPEYK